MFTSRRVLRHCTAAVAFWFLVSSATVVAAKNQKNDRVIRWNEANPECTLSAGDGMHRYTIAYETVKVTLAVNDNELKRTNRTAEHLFSVLVTVNNRGTQAVKVVPPDMKLELVRHHRTTLRALYPGAISQKLQDDTDELVYQSEKNLKKHPEEKENVEYRLKAHEELVAQWQAFISTQALRETDLNSGRPEVTGWVFFKTSSKWLGGDWKDEEDFVLRIPIGKRIFEFPFKLPMDTIPALRERN